MSRPEPILRLENIHKRYAGQEVLRGVSLELSRGDIKVILGPSGSGKSTAALHQFPRELRTGAGLAA